MTQVQITKVEVLVGLDEDLNENDKKQFPDWIQNEVKTEFGAVGTYKISHIAKAKKVEPPKEPPTLF